MFTEGNCWGDDIRHARIPGRGALGCDRIPVVVVVAVVPGQKAEELMQLCPTGFFICPPVVAHGNHNAMRRTKMMMIVEMPPPNEAQLNWSQAAPVD